MPSPHQLKLQAAQREAGSVLHHVEKLEKCDGFTRWLGPKLFRAYDDAATQILDAHAKGQAPDSKAVATYHGLHDIVQAFRREKKAAETKFI